MSEEHDTGYELIAPFTCVKSAGGPYDDGAFVAGFQVGQLWKEMEVAAGETIERYVVPSIVHQLDLIAMHYGYLMTRDEGDQPPGLVGVSFVRAGESRP